MNAQMGHRARAEASKLTTPSCQLRLKARVNLGDQTAEFIPFEVISTAILTYFYLLLGTNVRILVGVLIMHQKSTSLFEANNQVAYSILQTI